MINYEEDDICPHCEEPLDFCECETLDSVAEGLGLYIDDDGHWVPKDDDYLFNVWDDRFWDDDNEED